MLLSTMITTRAESYVDNSRGEGIPYKMGVLDLSVYVMRNFLCSPTMAYAHFSPILKCPVIMSAKMKFTPDSKYTPFVSYCRQTSSTVSFSVNTIATNDELSDDPYFSIFEVNPLELTWSVE
jgi:hypothetical protein